MKKLPWFLKTGLVVTGVLGAFVFLSFTKALVNRRGETGGQFTPGARQEVSFEDSASSDTEEKSVLISGTREMIPLAADQGGQEIISPVGPDETVLIKPEAAITKDLEAVDETYAIHRQYLTEFCAIEIEPLGFPLHSVEFFGEDEKVVMLYFNGDPGSDIQAQKQAAAKLGTFIFGEFERKLGYGTGYLKVHLMLPEGNSFALTDEDYEKWKQSGEGEEALVEIHVASMFGFGQNTGVKPAMKADIHISPEVSVPFSPEVDIQILPETNTQISPLYVKDPVVTESSEEIPAFKADDLRQYLEEILPGYGWRVEGTETVDSRIYIFFDRARDQLQEGGLEDIIVYLCKEVFENYLIKTGQRVDAFKLIDQTNDTLTVFYRADMKILWPEGESDERLRAYIREGGVGGLVP